MRPKVAIVAGASGYVGRVLCEELLLQGWSVYGIYKNQETCVDIPCHKRFHIVVSTDNNHYGTLSDFKEADYDTTYGADAYFDLAWDTKNRSNPYKQMICVTETLGLFMGTRLKDLNVRTFVFVSSFLSFGYKHRMMRLTAEDIFYGGGKSFASDMMMAYSGVKDTPVFVEVILTNVYGPRSNDRFLDKTIDLLMKDHTAKFTSTGEQIYDFVYETDAAKAIIIAATDSPKSGPSWYLVQQHSGISLKAFIRVAYVPNKEQVILLDELGGCKIRNAEMARQIKEKGYDDYSICCGVDEEESIIDFRDAGLPARKAIVTPGSRKYTFEWLQCRTLVIDPARTPKAYNEIISYEHEVDGNGEVIADYPDGNDHWIDSLRYATSPLSMRRGESA